jgi:hypothetical protein
MTIRASRGRPGNESSSKSPPVKVLCQNRHRMGREKAPSALGRRVGGAISKKVIWIAVSPPWIRAAQRRQRSGQAGRNRLVAGMTNVSCGKSGNA